MFYEDLLNRGWRRSGTLLYKPDQRASCCPQYTIRLDSEAFHASKDQRQALNRFTKHIIGEDYSKAAAKLYPKSREQAKLRDTHFDITERVHECENTFLKSPPEPSQVFEVTLESIDFTEEKYKVYENYQRKVHQDAPHQISKQGFKRFLCSSPLPNSKIVCDGQEQHLGSYHQCYRIDGQLVAVGVLDLLPHCVSAVYFMYHESVQNYSFGKVGALREIALAKESGYRWWYAGFYIHSCVKMKYKGDYNPQYVLDPESYNWSLLNESMKKMLDESKYVSLSHEAADSGEDSLFLSVTENNALSTDDSATDEPVDSDEDEDCPVPFPNLPIFARNMPGILTKTQILQEANLDHIKISLWGEEAETSDLMSWAADDIESVESLKGIIAELVGAVGADLASKMVVALT